ncbi:hypothetical protein C8R47DRAFT_1210798 [Mycena vitilis]|nr:hypothetical protein C8R47DRAFT_1210798 [Mycena vitilis]
MPASSPIPIRPQCTQRGILMRLLRDLSTTVALCYVITLALLRCIALHLDFFGPPVRCSSGAQYEELAAYQAAIDNVSQVDVLRITTGCSLVGFAALELCLLLARRARGIAEGEGEGDTECGLVAVTAQQYPPEKLPQKCPYRSADNLGSSGSNFTLAIGGSTSCHLTTKRKDNGASELRSYKLATRYKKVIAVLASGVYQAESHCGRREGESTGPPREYVQSLAEFPYPDILRQKAKERDEGLAPGGAQQNDRKGRPHEQPQCWKTRDYESPSDRS